MDRGPTVDVHCVRGGGDEHKWLHLALPYVAVTGGTTVSQAFPGEFNAGAPIRATREGRERLEVDISFDRDVPVRIDSSMELFARTAGADSFANTVETRRFDRVPPRGVSPQPG